METHARCRQEKLFSPVETISVVVLRTAIICRRHNKAACWPIALIADLCKCSQEMARIAYELVLELEPK